MLNRLFKELFASNPGSPPSPRTPVQSHLKSRRQLEVAGQQVKTAKRGKKREGRTRSSERFILGAETHGTPTENQIPWKPAETQRQQERKTNTFNSRKLLSSPPTPSLSPSLPLSPLPSPLSPCPGPLVPRPPLPRTPSGHTMLFFTLLLEVIWILTANGGRYIWVSMCLSLLMYTGCLACLMEEECKRKPEG